MYAKYTVPSTQNVYTVSHREIVMMCCAIKAITGWHINETATISRERSGGQGYLAANRFGPAIGGSHSSMTAEGDNSVLMMKVAMEYLADLATKMDPKKNARGSIGYLLQQVTPGVVLRGFKGGSGTDVDFIRKILKIREELLFTQLAKVMMVKGGSKEEKRVARFKIWSQQQQDLVQSAARAYSERLISDLAIEKIALADAELQPILKKMYNLYLISLLQENIGFFLTNGLISKGGADSLRGDFNKLIADISPEALALAEGFGITEEMLSAPIARDWELYNSYDNAGEMDKYEDLVR